MFLCLQCFAMSVYCVSVLCQCACPRVSHSCLAQQLHQTRPVTGSNLKYVLDDAEEVIQETKAHLQRDTIGVTRQYTAT